MPSRIYFSLALGYGVPVLLIGGGIALLVFLCGRSTRRKDD
jgi:hypothetical protein